jgi:UDP-N-acetylmuramate dehydrogenase
MTNHSLSKATVSGDSLITAFESRLEKDKPLAPFTSYNTGGPARFFISATSAEDVASAVEAANRDGIKWVAIGGGSNLLVADKGFDGLVIHVAVKGLEVENETTVRAGAGESLQALVDFAAAKSLGGMEFAAGIWGTVGGAIYGNAGAYGGDMAGVLDRLSLVDGEGNIREEKADYCRFGYRDSYLKKTGEIVINTWVNLKKGNQELIRARVAEILHSRDGKHPTKGHSAGCFFKNIPDPSQPFGKLPAGKLLDEIGAKGMQVGGAQVYGKHANIIVNVGGASSKDIRRLADILKKKVKDRFGVTLEEEVIQIGDV